MATSDARLFIEGGPRVEQTGGTWRFPVESVQWEKDTEGYVRVRLEFHDGSHALIENGEATIDPEREPESE